MKGSIVDISGNPVGTLNSSGEVEFSEEDIEKFLTLQAQLILFILSPSKILWGMLSSPFMQHQKMVKLYHKSVPHQLHLKFRMVM